jgi:hypothetical protein
VVSPLVVVEAKVALERRLELPQLREVAPAEGHPPVVVLHEAVGEGMARLGPRVADAELSASLVEGSLELATSIGEQPVGLLGEGPGVDRQ